MNKRSRSVFESSQTEDDINLPATKQIRLVNENSQNNNNNDVPIMHSDDLEEFLANVSKTIDMNHDAIDDTMPNTSSQTHAFTMKPLAPVRKTFNTNDVSFIVQTTKNKYHRFTANFDHSGIKHLKQQSITQPLTTAMKTGASVTLSEKPQENVTKGARPNQQRSLNVKITAVSDIDIIIGDEGSPTNTNPYELFGINYQLNDCATDGFISFVGFLVHWEPRSNFIKGYIHIIDHDNNIIQSVVVGMQQTEHDPYSIIPKYGKVIVLNAQVKYMQDNHRIYITYADIINITSDNAFKDFAIVPPLSMITLQTTGLTNCYYQNNNDRIEWNQRTEIDIDLKKEIIKTLHPFQVYRVNNVKFTDCSKYPLELFCAEHHVALKDDSLYAKKCLPTNHHTLTDTEYNFKYGSSVTLTDSNGNSIYIKPHWEFMTEAIGKSVHYFAEYIRKTNPEVSINTFFREKIFQPLLKSKSFTVDFMKCDENNYGRIRENRLFVCQIHPNNDIQPISFNRIYVKNNPVRQ